MTEPETRLVLEAPGGLIEAVAQCEGGKVQRVEVKNVPSFADRLDAMIEVEGLGSLKVDTAYGGDSFVIADARALGFSLTADEAADLVATGLKITRAANEQLGFVHPLNKDWDHISFCQIAAPLERIDGVLTAANAVVIRPGKIDRSPCGTGCSARMAVLHAKGELPLDRPFRHQSILGNVYTGRLVEETTIAGRAAVVPEVSGTSWIYGLNTLVLDHDDPFTEGFTVGDTWA